MHLLETGVIVIFGWMNIFMTFMDLSPGSPHCNTDWTDHIHFTSSENIPNI